MDRMIGRRLDRSRWLVVMLAALVLVCVTLAVYACQSDGDGGTRIEDDDDDSGTGGHPSDDDATDDDSADDDDDDDGSVRDVTQSGCLDPPAGAGWTESLTLNWDGAELAVAHGGTCRDCGFVLEVYGEQCDRSINLSEFNDPDDEPADCRCLFDLSYVMTDLVPGDYTLIVQSDDFGGGTETVFEEDVLLPEGEAAHYEFSLEHDGVCD